MIAKVKTNYTITTIEADGGGVNESLQQPDEKAEKEEEDSIPPITEEIVENGPVCIITVGRRPKILPKWLHGRRNFSW